MITLKLKEDELKAVIAAVQVHYCNMMCDFPVAYKKVRAFHKELVRKLKEARND